MRPFFVAILPIVLTFGCKPSATAPAQPKLGGTGRTGGTGAAGASGANATRLPGAPTGATDGGLGKETDTDVVAIPEGSSATAAKTTNDGPEKDPLFVVKASNGHLFEPGDFDVVTSLVLPYQKPDADIDELTNASKRYDDYRKFLESTVNQGMLAEKLAPGRKFTFTVLEDPEINAFADGYQQLFVNTGFLEKVSIDTFMAAVCHEIAHSARNHGAVTDVFKEQDAQQKVYEYFDKQYNFETNVYTHDKTAYAALRGNWDIYSKDLSVEERRQESEADIIGGMICGTMGMPYDRYLKGFQQLFGAEAFGGVVVKDGQSKPAGDGSDPYFDGFGLALAGESKELPADPMTLQNGAQIAYELGPLVRTLFPVAGDDHPGDEERVSQLKRVGDPIRKRGDDKAKTFQAITGKFVEQPAGLSLVNLVVKRTMKASSGQVLAVPKAGCMDRWWHFPKRWKDRKGKGQP